MEPSGLDISQRVNVFTASGGALSITSGRLSYMLGLVGPCYSIDTACSSALSALHLAVGSLECNTSNQVVVTATKILSERSSFAISVAGMTSTYGRCHTFDWRADGYCRGEGCGTVVLQGDKI